MIGRIKRAFAIALAFCLSIGAVSVTASCSAEEAGTPDIVFPYAKIAQGQVDRKPYGVFEKVTDSEKGEVYKITPTPDASEEGVVTVDAWALDKYKVNLNNYNTLRIEYKFTSESSKHHVPSISISGYGGKTLKKWKSGVAAGKLVKDKWAVMEFDLTKITKDNIGTDGILWQMHLSPFGTGFKNTGLTDGESILLGNLIFSAEKFNEASIAQEVVPVKVTFDYKYDVGKETEVHGNSGSTITLPESMEKDGLVLSKWFCETDSKHYAPGAQYKLPNKDSKFYALWQAPGDARDFSSVSYSEYTGGVCNRVDTATWEIVPSYDGFDNVVKITPNPASTDNSAITMDGWTYGGAKFDVEKYSTIMMVYKYVSEKPLGGKPRLHILKGQNFTKGYYMEARETIIEGKWAIASFDISEAGSIVEEGKTPYITQMHILPLGNNTPSNMLITDEIYIADLIAVTDDTSSVVYNASYIDGYSDGTFKPNGNMTRAEACTVLARLIAGGDEFVPADGAASFTDVAKTEWYTKYVAYCEAKGLLSSYSGTFSPNQNITRAEFVELVYKMGLMKDAGKNGKFTDVSESHKLFSVVTAAGQSGLVNGYANGDGTYSFRPDNTITRAEVVKVINNSLGRSSTAETVKSAGCDSRFADVDAIFWGYAEIIDASTTHISCKAKTGKEAWYVMKDANDDSSFNPDYEAAAKKAAEVEALMEKRIAEIRATKDELKVTGRRIYVSNNGNDSNDGLSEATAKATVQSAQQIAKKGDAILFQRGGEWRFNITTVEGVSYGAYGTGPKPIINGNTTGNAADPTLWTLVPGTNNIYTYRDKLRDVGNIIYDDGSIYTDKLVPSINESLELCTNNKKYDPATSHTANNTFFMVYDGITSRTLSMPNVYGTLYLRCDEGNPGSVYKSIEIASYGHAFIAKSDNTFDNLCILYAGGHGITGGTGRNLVITNCEVGFIGGTSQYINNGKNTRYGNGIQIYGGCDGYIIDNCYVYECYDAGISPQYSAGGVDEIIEKNIYFTNNVIDKCIYNIEYFIGSSDNGAAERYMENVFFKDNILARSGYGWGMSPSRSACIKGWDNYNKASNFEITGNIIYNPRYNAYHIGADFEGWLPVFKDNVYIIRRDSHFVKYGANGSSNYVYNSSADETAKKVLGETGYTLYYLDPEFSEK